jgi:hypothetical protein
MLALPSAVCVKDESRRDTDGHGDRHPVASPDLPTTG